MSRDLKEIAAEALELPPTARAELASQLLESLEDISKRRVTCSGHRRLSDALQITKLAESKQCPPMRCSPGYVLAGSDAGWGLEDLTQHPKGCMRVAGGRAGGAATGTAVTYTAPRQGA